ncbi:alpha-galactosidase [Brachybacterium huguangmaarense]
MSVTRTGDVFVIRTGSSAYALALDSSGIPARHLWWGGPISDADAVALAGEATGVRRPSGNIPDPLPHDEELPIEGGRRQGAVGLALEIIGSGPAVRGLDIGRTEASIDGETLRVRLVDDRAGVSVVLGYEAFPEHAVIRRWTEVHDEGTASLVLAPPASAHVPIPRTLVATDPAPGVHQGVRRLCATLATGDYGTETTTTATELTPGSHVWSTRTGTPGHQQQPFVAISAGARETAGRVCSVQLAWNGSHRLEVAAHQDGAVHVDVGIDPDRAPVRLDPGESFTTPSAYLHTGDGGMGATSRAWHAFERDVVSPHGHAERPIVVNSWESTYYAVDLESQTELARVAADLGAEMLVVDDGWFDQRTTDETGLGDWFEDPVKFPGGMRVLSDRVHALGLRFGLWLDAESLSPRSNLMAEHPEWVLRWPDREPVLVRNQLTLDLSREDVRDFIVGTVDRLVSVMGLDMIKWDMNRPLVEPFSPHATSSMILQARGLTEVWERIRAAHPDLLLETCQSGGGRADLHSLSLADWTWTSDDTDALERLAIQDGYSLVHGAHTMSCWVTDCPNTLTTRTAPLEFRFHVAMCGVLGLGGALAEWDDDERDIARRLVSAYRAHRATIQQGHLHRASRTTDSGQVLVRGYAAQDGREAVVLTFAPSVRLLEHTQLVPLGGLVDPDARYRVERVLATGEAEHEEIGTWSGALLAERGIPVHLRGDLASAMHVLTRLAPEG